MRLHRFIVLTLTEAKTQVIDDSKLAHQLKNVFRFKSGDTLILCNGNGMEAKVLIEKLEKNKIEVSLAINDVKKISENKNKKTLCIAFLKKENLELVVQKATELGINDFVFLKTDRIVKKEINMERLGVIAKEATEQCGGMFLPLMTISSFEEACKKFSKKGILLDPTSSKSIKKFSAEKTKALFIGPEGGWSQEEIATADKNGIAHTKLGERIFRAETAAIAGTIWLSNILN